MPDIIENVLLAQLRLHQAQLRQAREQLGEQDWQPPDPPPDPPPFSDFRLKPLAMSSLPPLPAAVSLETARAELPRVGRDYLDSDTDSVLLVRGDPGIGKTHALVDVAQAYARAGKRGLWAASRHDMFGDLSQFQHFDKSLWYHWQGIQGKLNDAPVCRYAEAQQHWSQKGYDAMALCWQLCGKYADNHIQKCPYRGQERCKTPLIFGQHYHIVTGLAISKFDFAIVDELPLSAFVQERIIPVNGLDVGAIGPLDALISALRQAAFLAPKGGRVAGRALFNQIGQHIPDALAQIDVATALPMTPRIYSEADVVKAPYWYVFDMLRLATAEQRAWESGWANWNERIWVTSTGLHLLERSPLWEKIPAKLIVLDATAQADLYQSLFARPVEVHAPRVVRQGRLHQIVGRLNAKNAAIHRSNLTDEGRLLVETVQALARQSQRPGVVCWKALQPHFARVFGAENVMTFGGLRGANGLQGVDDLFVVGTYTPNGSAMLDLAVALSGDLEPFWQVGADNRREPLYRYSDREYRLSPAGVATLQLMHPEAQAAARRTGHYSHPTLDAIHRQLREAELIQAIHRARLTINPATCWLITSTPLADEVVDGIWQDPPVGPPGIYWRTWLALEPWLRQQHEAGTPITYESLAQAAHVEVDHAKRNRWLDLIAAHMPAVWQVGQLQPTGRGRPPRAAFPKPIPANLEGSRLN